MNSKAVFGTALVCGAAGLTLGIWAGFADSQPTAMHVQRGLATLIGANFFLSLWLWVRAAPGSGDRRIAPTTILLSAAMLVGILPRIFWPTLETLHIAASILSIAMSLTMLFMVIRQSRRRRRSAADSGTARGAVD
jgi:hypothetical protein